MASISIRDISSSGHTLSGATVEGLPQHATVREIISTRVRSEVTAYNADPGTDYVGMVQPQDAVRYSDGFRMRSPRRLDADHLLIAVEEAVAAELLHFWIGDQPVTDLDADIDLAVHDELTAIMQRPVVARSPNTS